MSFLVHAAAIVVLYVAQFQDAATPEHEVVVDLVQMPPPRPKVPSPGRPAKPLEQADTKQANAKPPNPAKPPSPAKPPPKPAAPPQLSVAERMEDLIGPMPGMAALALPEEAEAGEAVSYSRIVMSRIGKANKQGGHPGVPGYATVTFTLGDGGEVTSLALKRPSGDTSLDTEAIALIKRAEPYPPPPPGGRRDYVVTLEFRVLPP